MSELLVDIGLVAAAGIALYLLIKLLAKPIKGLLKFLLHVAFGIAMLLAVNYVGSFFQFKIEITWLTTLVSGIGGVPGVILLILLQLLL
ncbi:MAG: pro-sigmaK processing inhibitor BofA family protein [Oscillospiraceae bacterium]|nr:pro-sigmaK processing inhibitor BofA family protein [Oscillospiraceae bacterium]